MPEALQFVAGGAVQAGGGVYLERDADRDLLRHCRAGDFTYVLTSRQMGKSSLMYRAAERLAEGDARAASAALHEGLDAWQELEAPYEEARTRVLIALTCRQLGDDDSADLEFDAASLVLCAFGRCNTGTVRGDRAVAEQFLGSFFRI